MKKRYTPILTTLKRFLLLVPISICFFSCDSLMDGSNLKSELTKKIEYAKSPEFSIRIMSDEGTTTPGGDQISKVKDYNHILFSAYTDYQFVKWLVINRETNKIYSDAEADEIIEFDDRFSADTYYNVKQKVENLLIKPLCEERPKDLSTFPLYKPSGVNRDSRIKVFFDHKLSEDSIYFSGEELLELGADCDWEFAQGNSWKKDIPISSITVNDKIYGYKAPDGDYQFKNIFINDANGNNLLQHFETPFLEAGDTLIIPTSTLSGDNLPPAGIDIIVTVNQMFYYHIDENSVKTKISMNMPCKWNYRINDGKDTTKPNVSSLKLQAKSNYKNPETSSDITGTSSTKPCHLVDRKLYLYAIVTDTGNGPDTSFKLEYKRIKTANNDSTSEYSNVTIIPYTDTSATEKHIFGTTSSTPSPIDLSDQIDGTYEATLHFYDLAGNESNPETFYFILDNTPPQSPVEFTSNGTLSATWTSGWDTSYAEWRYRVKDSVNAFTTKQISSLTKNSSRIDNLEGLSDATSYEIQFIQYDERGNASTPATTTFIKPKLATNCELTQNSSSPTTKLNLKWGYPDKNTGLLIYVGTSDKFSNSTYKDYWPALHSTTSYTYTNFTPGTKYYVWVVSYIGLKPDSSNVLSGKALNINYGSPLTVCTKPTSVTNLNVTSTTSSSVSLSWTKPSSGNVSKYNIYAKDLTNGESSFKSKTNTTATSATVSGLTAGHQYTFCVRTYAAETESADTTTTTVTKPATATGLQIKQTDSTSVKLGWTKPSGSVVGYNIYKKDLTNGDTSFAYATYTTSTASNVEQNIYSLVPGHQYTFSVRTYIKYNNKEVESDDSTIIAVTTPSNVTGLKITATTASSVTLSWTKPSSGKITGYNIYAKDLTKGDSSFTYKTYTTGTSATVSGLTEGDQYTFRVTTYVTYTKQEYNSSGVDKTSTVMAASTYSLSSTTKGTFNINWTYPEGCTGIVILWGTSSNISSATSASWTKSYGTKSTSYKATSGTTYYVWVVPYSGTTCNADQIKNGTATNIPYPISSYKTVKIK